MPELLLVLGNGEEIHLPIDFQDFPDFDVESEDHREELFQAIEVWLEEHYG